MHLLVPDLPYPVPVHPSPMVGTQDEVSIDVRIFPNNPLELAFVPGRHVTLVNDENLEQLIVLGKGWTTIHRGSVMRIQYSDLQVEQTI